MHKHHLEHFFFFFRNRDTMNKIANPRETSRETTKRTRVTNTLLMKQTRKQGSFDRRNQMWPLITKAS